MMKVSIFGAGYVGAVSSACISSDGHTVIAVDPNEDKVSRINIGISPIIEKGLPEMISANVKSGALSATTDPFEAIMKTQITIIAVGTPSQSHGGLDLQYVQRTCEQIGEALAQKDDDFHIVVNRSTMLPGTMHDLVIPTLEKYSGRKVGETLGVGIFPEFLRESTAIEDYYSPALSIYGAEDERVIEALRSINAKVESEEVITDLRTAEAIKYANNAWHATKIGFANEIGNFCKPLGIDSHKVMEVLCRDDRLNISKAYLKPGFAFGGSCLPKDLRAMQYKAKSMDVSTPLFDALLEGNIKQIDRAFSYIHNSETKKVGLLGLSFKAGTDDLRESPLVALVERMVGKGYDVKIYDQNVNLAGLTGTNLQFLTNKLEHLSELMVDNIEDVEEHADLLVIGNGDPAFSNVAQSSIVNGGAPVLDLVRINNDFTSSGKYYGLSW